MESPEDTSLGEVLGKGPGEDERLAQDLPARPVPLAEQPSISRIL